MAISLKRAKWLINGGGCTRGRGERFTVAVEVETCQVCEPGRYHFLKEHEIPAERWPTPLQLEALTQAVRLLLDNLDSYVNKAIKVGRARRACIDIELANAGRLDEIRANLQSLLAGLVAVECRS